MKVLFWSRVPFARTQTLGALSEIESVEVEMVESLEDCVGAVGDADLLVTGDAPAAEAAEVLAAMAAGRTRGIHFISAGRDGFEQAGVPEDMVVTGPVGANAATVAEHALALTLALYRQMGEIAKSTEQREWAKRLITSLRSLEGARVLIVGLGQIGREVAARIRPFGAHVVGLQRTPRPDDSVDELAILDTLDEQLPLADVVIVTVALSEGTHRLFDAARLTRMKSSAVLVNVARGPIVDTEALAAALTAGTIAGAGVDVTDPEPLPQDHPLWDAPNVLISPHFAGGGSPRSMQRVGRSAADRAQAMLQEERNLV